MVVSAQHSEEVTTEQLRKDIKEKIVQKVIPARYLDDDTIYHVGHPLQTCGKGRLLTQGFRYNLLDSSSSAALKQTQG